MLLRAAEMGDADASAGPTASQARAPAAPRPRPPRPRAGSPPRSAWAFTIERDAVTSPAAGWGAKAAARSSTRPPWAPTPGSRKTARGISSRRRPSSSGRVAPGDGARPATARSRPTSSCAELVDQRGQPLVQRRLARVLQLGGAGVRGADEHEAAGAGRGRGLDQRLERVAPEQRVGGEGVGAEARRPARTGRRSPPPAPGRRRAR